MEKRQITQRDGVAGDFTDEREVDGRGKGIAARDDYTLGAPGSPRGVEHDAGRIRIHAGRYRLLCCGNKLGPATFAFNGNGTRHNRRDLGEDRSEFCIMQQQRRLAIGDDLAEFRCAEAPVQGHEDQACTLTCKAHGDLLDGVAPQKGDALHGRRVANDLQKAVCGAGHGEIQRPIIQASTGRHFVDRWPLRRYLGAVDDGIVRLKADGSRTCQNRLDFRLHACPPHRHP